MLLIAGHGRAGHPFSRLSAACGCRIPRSRLGLVGARLRTPITAILIPMGFFLSVASPEATAPQYLDLSDMAWRSRAWLVSAVARCVADPIGASLKSSTASTDRRASIRL
jgi:hypothetical protein